MSEFSSEPKFSPVEESSTVIEGLEVENQNLEDENVVLRQRIQDKEDTLKSSPTGLQVIKYVLGTNPNILLSAVRAKRNDHDSDTGLLDRIAQLEREKLEDEHSIDIIEPGEIAADLIDSISEDLQHSVYMSSEESRGLVNFAIEQLKQSGNFTFMDIRKISDALEVLPREHILSAISSLEKTPVKFAQKVLKDLQEDLGKSTDMEMGIRVQKIEDKLRKRYSGMGAYIRPTKRQVVVSSQMSSLFTWMLSHEVAHGVFENMLTREQRENWAAISTKAITQYGEHADDYGTRGEAFAEMYSLYILNRPLFYTLSVIDEEYKNQYHFFHSFMPETSRIPKKAGILYPLSEKAAGVVVDSLERFIKLPHGSRDILGKTYDRKGREEIEDENEKRVIDAYSEMSRKIFGLSDAEVQLRSETEHIDHNLKKLISEGSFDVLQGRKIYRVLVESNILSEAREGLEDLSYEGRSVYSYVAHGSNADVFVLTDLKPKDIGSINFIPVFLEDTVLIITPQGVKKVLYKVDVQDKLDEALLDTDFDIMHPLTYEVQVRDREVLKTRSTSDQMREFNERFGIELIESDVLGFSEDTLSKISPVLEKLPQDDIRNIPTISRGALTKLMSFRGRLLARTLGLEIDNNSIAEPLILREAIIGTVGYAVGRNNKEFIDEFIKISGWEKVKGPLKKGILHLIGRGSGYPLYRLNKNGNESFLSLSGQASLMSDFIQCYGWYVFHHEEFRKMSERDPILKAKYELMEGHFSKKNK